ncbi:unnamed protein product, partial [Anisakis simplex]|uniref:NADH dehydrogenase [ubiquinone] 1 alpha subcomplex subunit 10, mitochondrial n=1 Tax=Anisakis simplex TaxID=6269 RepID=A0A0M3KHP1_ANISI
MGGNKADWVVVRTEVRSNGSELVSEFPPLDTLDDSRRLHLINAFRRYGYRVADLDPLHLKRPPVVHELKPELYGLNPESVLRDVGISIRVADLIDKLNAIYCGNIATEFMHIKDWEERTWFAQRFEDMHRVEIRADEKRRYAELMLRSQNFDRFMSLKFPTVKRYGGEG